ncbi:ATP-binding protein [Ligilactobacillus aviarius]|uniref:ATP-binding protein n=1 Tax=Ligilactobacillus aviarius TaxID=1606 RepID=UPI0024BAA1A5|nr:ATP-binding protein [Ligilactobacillus aviarius]
MSKSVSLPPLGVIVSVNGDIAQVGMYSKTNDASILWDGKLLNGPKVGTFLTINQNDIKIIATVISEEIIDQQNNNHSEQFDNRFHSNSINRIITLKTQGVIENNSFKTTSKYVPMIGNEIFLISQEDIDLIYDTNANSVSIGKSIKENNDIKIPIDSFFASHIGIFGNTGSGKSNTLHKLYSELFKKFKRTQMIEKSKFFVIDFNGEYTQPNQFNIDGKNKQVFNIDTNNKENTDKIPIDEKYLFDSDILAVLFDAKPGVQKPFLDSALNEFKRTSPDKLAKSQEKLFAKLILKYKDLAILNSWLDIFRKYNIESNLISLLKVGLKNDDYTFLTLSYQNDTLIHKGIFNSKKQELKDDLFNSMKERYINLSKLDQLHLFLDLKKISVTINKLVNIEHINPLFKRIDISLNSLKSVIKLTPQNNEENFCENVKIDTNCSTKQFKFLNIINLVNANLETKRTLSMLISKMIYDNQKRKSIKSDKPKSTCHLIIDEAHNILNDNYSHNSDNSQDYRLSTFEEIIKEGRKFGFFLTLASQRPADISPTIISQLHNFVIHRLVNQNDLHILESTMSTLDNFSFKQLPSLGQGEAIITGTAIQLPTLVKIDKEDIRPKSDDISLISLWKKEEV